MSQSLVPMITSPRRDGSFEVRPSRRRGILKYSFWDTRLVREDELQHRRSPVGMEAWPFERTRHKMA